MINYNVKNRRGTNCKKPYKFFILEGVISFMISYIVFYFSAHLVLSGTVFIIMMLNPFRRLGGIVSRCKLMKREEDRKMDIRTRKGFMPNKNNRGSND